MKMRFVWSGFCLALLLLPGACSKSTSSDKLPPMQVEGVNVDIPQLSAAFTTAPPELQSRVSSGTTKVRYKQYLESMADLDGVLNSPGLNDKQKQLLTQVIGQLKEVVNKTPPAH
jgi:hypothetical protein